MFRLAIANSSQRFRMGASVTIAGVGSAAITLAHRNNYPKLQSNQWNKKYTNELSSENTQIKKITTETNLNPNEKSTHTNPLEFSNENSPCSQSPSSNILPTLQAMNRARRLVQTIFLMIMQYEKAKMDQSEILQKMRFVATAILDSFSLVTTPNGQIGMKQEDNEILSSIESQQTFWEQEFDKRKQILEKAQHDYTTEPSEDDIKEWGKLHNVHPERSMKDEYQEDKKKAVREAATALGEAEDMLAKIGDRRSVVHLSAARRLLQLCRENGGVYVKIGQHLANLDYLIPAEYIKILSELFDDAPVSTYSDVCEVVKEELGKYPDEIFEYFSEEPIASASLAQVHVALEKGTGRKLAVKVQHRGLRETSVGDLMALELAVGIVDSLFDDFTYGWIVDEIAPNLPIELDFINEGENAEKAAEHLKTTDLDCIIPEVIWNKTTSRVLCMQFEEGFKSTNLEDIRRAGLDKKEVAHLISSVFNAQVFQSGFVHCDPHPANVLLREHPKKPGMPQVVLVDHGLYKQIDDDFRITYASLWKSLMMADLDGIKCASEKLGIGKMHPLLAAILTSRPFDEIIERSKSGSINANVKMDVKGDKAMIQGYVQRYLREIFSLLNLIPRQMLLLLKMNDCLRHVDFALGSPSNTLVVAGNYASDAVFQYRNALSKNWLNQIENWVDYIKVRLRVMAYETGLWWFEICRPFI